MPEEGGRQAQALLGLSITAGETVQRTLVLNESRTPMLIFRSDLLPISETFILAQANALKRFKPRFVGLRRVSSGLELPDNVIVAADGDGVLRQCSRGIYKTIGI